MLTHLRMLTSIFSFMSLLPGSGEEPVDPPTPDPDPKDPPKPDDLPDDKSKWTVEQWEKENQRIAAKEKAEGRKAAEREFQAKQDEEKRKADLAKQESEGEYEKAKSQLTTERDTAVQERDRALELLKANVDTQWDGLPEEVKATYTGNADDVLAKSSHMNLMKPVIDRLKSDAEKEGERSNPGNPKGPKPTDKVTTSEEDEAAKRTVRPRL